MTILPKTVCISNYQWHFFTKLGEKIVSFVSLYRNAKDYEYLGES